MDYPKIIAVDFDGCLCKNAYPKIGAPNNAVINAMKAELAHDSDLILWTMREGNALAEALEWCKKHGLTFSAVNDNIDRMKQFYGNNPRKIYANLYISDDDMIKVDENGNMRRA